MSDTKPQSFFRQRVMLACCNALERHGFNRFRKYNVDYVLNRADHCWVGLNVSSAVSGVQINPFVGLHSVELERFVALLEQKKYDRASPTYSVHFGELDSGRNIDAFCFSPTMSAEHLESESMRLAALYFNHGINYATYLASGNTLRNKLLERVDFLGGFPKLYAAALYIEGERAESIQFVCDFMTKEPDYFTKFGNELLRYAELELRP